MPDHKPHQRDGSRARICRSLTTLALLATSITVMAQSPSARLGRDAATGAYPDRPVRYVVSFPAGGGADSLARLMGQKLSDASRQQVVVDNRGGAGGTIAADIVARAAPDGYTLLQSSVGHAISASLYEKLSYDLRRDFVAVTELASAPFLLVVKPTLGVSSVPEMIAAAKAKPSALTYASSGSGGPSHLAMELFKSRVQIDVRHIPYKGVAQATPDLLSGRVDMMFSTIAAMMPLVKEGKIRALAVTSSKRSPAAPNFPTVDESGIKGFEVSTWFGVHAPRGTPEKIVAVLHQQLEKILRQPDTVDRLGALGFDVVSSSPKEFSERVTSELAKWAAVVKRSGARVE